MMGQKWHTCTHVAADDGPICTANAAKVFCRDDGEEEVLPLPSALETGGNTVDIADLIGFIAPVLGCVAHVWEMRLG